MTSKSRKKCRKFAQLQHTFHGLSSPNLYIVLLYVCLCMRGGFFSRAFVCCIFGTHANIEISFILQLPIKWKSLKMLKSTDIRKHTNPKNPFDYEIKSTTVEGESEKYLSSKDSDKIINIASKDEKVVYYIGRLFECASISHRVPSTNTDCDRSEREKNVHKPKAEVQ